jgi:hypothetical protein
MVVAPEFAFYAFFVEQNLIQETIKNRMISLFKSSPIYLIISSTKFLIDRAQSLIILETRSPVNFVDIVTMRFLPYYI